MAEEHIKLPSPPFTSGSPSVPPPSDLPGPGPLPAAPRPKDKPAPAETKDSLREIVETIVFVVVLVLLLKSFVAEAFVIPTGSMAETLWGYQKKVTCPLCGQVFPVNCSSEVDPQQEAQRAAVVGCTCPNCWYQISFTEAFEGAVEDVGRNIIAIKDSKGKSGQFTVDRGAKITLDGEKTQLEDLKRYAKVWVIYRLSDKEAVSIEAVTKGSLKKEDQPFDPSWNTGDRVLVAKFPYDSHLSAPHRHDVVVFKFPDKPQNNYVPWNYIKRLIGLPGETIAIHYGKLYVLKPGEGPTFDQEEAGVPAVDLWQKPYLHVDNQRDLDLFGEGKFAIIRKAPGIILAMRRIVYDNDHPARDLEGKVPPRWAGRVDGTWTALGNGFQHQGEADGELSWLSYRHFVTQRTIPGQVSGGDWKPQLITDFMGYNSGEQERGGRAQPGKNWTGDLIVECEAAIEQPRGELVLELSKGKDRFQAKFDLASGDCTLTRRNDDGETVLATKPTVLKSKGTYRLRFANVDERLVVWVNGKLPFGDGWAYDAPKQLGPYENDLQPASVGARGTTVAITKLQLWRDTYYTLEPATSPGSSDVPPRDRDEIDWSVPSTWGPLRNLGVKTLYVHPGHYLCLGDNSPESSDGRSWGTVPERLMLGRALMVYWPLFSRGGPIR